MGGGGYSCCLFLGTNLVRGWGMVAGVVRNTSGAWMGEGACTGNT